MRELTGLGSLGIRYTALCAYILTCVSTPGAKAGGEGWVQVKS